MTDADRLQEILKIGTAAAERFMDESLAAGGACDICAGLLDGSEATWRTARAVELDIIVFSGSEAASERRDYGTDWAVCRACEPLVAQGDPYALARYVAGLDTPRRTALARLSKEEALAFLSEVERDLVTLYTAVYQAGWKRVDGVAHRRGPITSKRQGLDRARQILAQAHAINRMRTADSDKMSERERLDSRRRSIGLYLEVEALDRQHALGIFDEREQAELRYFEERSNLDVERLAAQERAARIAARAERREPDAHPEGTRCACGKAARINGMCKPCARAAGVLGKGKSI